MTLATYAGSPPAAQQRTQPAVFEGTFELELDGGRYLIVRSRGASTDGLVVPGAAEAAPAAAAGAGAAALGGVRLEDVAPEVGLDFRHSAFHFRVSRDPVAMMGGGVCWLDYDADGWLDLFAVNSYSIELDLSRWREQGGLPRSALFRNAGGSFVDVSRGSGADVDLRGNGCVAADFNLDGRTDLYVTAAGYDALLWNDGRRPVQRGRARGRESLPTAGMRARPSETSTATVSPTCSSPATRISTRRFPTRARAFPRPTPPFATSSTSTRARTRTAALGSARSGCRPGSRRLGSTTASEPCSPTSTATAASTSTSPTTSTRTGSTRTFPGPVERAPIRPGSASVSSSAAAPRAWTTRTPAWESPPPTSAPTAAPTSFVTNSHRQLHGVFESSEPEDGGALFADGRPTFAPAFDTTLAGWGVSSADLDLDGDLDLVLANGAIPVTDLAADAEPIQVLENLAANGQPERVADASSVLGVESGPRVIGRGLAAADYDNDGDVDVAINSIAGPLVLLENAGAPGRWLEVELGGVLARHEGHGRAARTDAGSCARCRRAAATSRRRTRGSTSAWGRQRG